MSVKPPEIGADDFGILQCALPACAAFDLFALYVTGRRFAVRHIDGYPKFIFSGGEVIGAAVKGHPLIPARFDVDDPVRAHDEGLRPVQRYFFDKLHVRINGSEFPDRQTDMLPEIPPRIHLVREPMLEFSRIPDPFSHVQSSSSAISAK